MCSVNVSLKHVPLNVGKPYNKLVSYINRYDHMHGLHLHSRGKEKLLNVEVVNIIAWRQINTFLIIFKH